MVEAARSRPNFRVGGYGRGTEVAWMPTDHDGSTATANFEVLHAILPCARLSKSGLRALFSAQKSTRFCFDTSVRCPIHESFSLHDESVVRLHEYVLHQILTLGRPLRWPLQRPLRPLLSVLVRGGGGMVEGGILEAFLRVGGMFRPVEAPCSYTPPPRKLKS